MQRRTTWTRSWVVAPPAVIEAPLSRAPDNRVGFPEACDAGAASWLRENELYPDSPGALAAMSSHFRTPSTLQNQACAAMSCSLPPKVTGRSHGPSAAA